MEVDFIAIIQAIRVRVLVPIVDTVPVGIHLQRVGAVFHFIVVVQAILIGVHYIWISLVDINLVAVVQAVLI